MYIGLSRKGVELYRLSSESCKDTLGFLIARTKKFAVHLSPLKEWKYAQMLFNQSARKKKLLLNECEKKEHLTSLVNSYRYLIF